MKRAKRTVERFILWTTAVLIGTAGLLFGCDQNSAFDEESEAPPVETPYFKGAAVPSAAASEDLIGIEGVTVEPLARAGFPDKIGGMYRINLLGSPGTTVSNIRDSKDVVFAKLTFDPAGFVGWHTHPGPAVVAVASGDLTIVNESDCVPRLYSAGEAFIDPGQGNVHVAVNDTEEEVVVYVSFLDIPPDMGPTQLLLDEPAECSW